MHERIFYLTQTWSFVGSIVPWEVILKEFLNKHFMFSSKVMFNINKHLRDSGNKREKLILSA